MPDADRSLKAALFVDSLNARARRSMHPENLAHGLKARGWRTEVVPVTGGLLGLFPRRESKGDAPTVERVEDADILVAYDSASPAAWTAARLARRLDRPLVVVEPAWFSLRAPSEAFRVRFGLLLWGRLVRSRTRLAIAIDPLAADQLAEHGFRRELTHVVPAAVDTDTFRPGLASRLGTHLRLARHYVLCVGHLSDGRGIDVLVRAFARSVGQREDWNLVLVGSGVEARRIEALCNRLGVWARVHIVPLPADQRDLAGLFSAATMYVAPAEDERVRGRNLSRALAAGLPCIATDLPRMRLRVEHDVNGLIVVPGDDQALAAALTRMAGAPEARRRWSGESRRIAIERFSIPPMAARIDELLRAVLDQDRGAAEQANAQPRR
ncbi:Putative glycosyltransferase EpsD [Planctomycetes bacterium Pla163]|uniref:Glycosyltransferase EpsD n=1 Tax=Rohdeia mirabilis TaxID=2528008 RepID=A0A518D0Z0_9BACT|nr:Putative glycosyltransferase EpsD [Planctomycetes bacterium Pla163]